MEPANGLVIKDLCLYHKKTKTLILADFHMGFEEALNVQGVLVPRFQYEETKKRIEKILQNLEIKTIVINGDLKHEFGKISKTEWDNTLGLLNLLSKYSKEIILLKGNHDTILAPIARRKKLEIKKSHTIGDIFICHGHEIPKIPAKIKTIVIAHEHPAVGLTEGAKTEIFKCFLKGKYKNKTLVVIPSFNLVLEGYDILREKLLSPFLTNVSDFQVYVVSDKIYDFGLVKGLESKY